MKKSWILMLTVLCLIFSLCNTALPVQAAEEERYGYSLLTTEIQRSAYHAIAAGIGEAKAEISFTIPAISQDAVSALFDEIEQAEKMVLKDYPEYFWYHGGYRVNVSGTTVTLIPSAYSVAGETVTAGSAKLNNAKSKLEQAVSAALATLPRNPSDYEIAHGLHDYLVNNVEYLEVGDHQTSYGALVSGKAVCAGYARAYQLLMTRAGIRCAYISGKSYNPQGVLIPHAWNLVWLDGKCYYTDVTWDDQGAELFHEYLNMSKGEMQNTHFADAGEILPSSCSHDNYRFFIKNRGKGVCDIQSLMSDDDIADYFELKSRNGNQAVYYCTIHYHGDDFNTWFNEHYATIGQKLGFTSYEISLIELGHEHHVTYSGELRSGATQPTQAPTTATAAPTQPTASTAATPPTTPTQPTTRPTTATQAPTTTPTQASTVAPTQLTQPTVPTTPANPTNPANTTNPTQQTQATTQATAPAESAAPTQGTANPPSEGTQASIPTETSRPDQSQTTEGTVAATIPTEPTSGEPDDASGQDNQGSMTWIIASIVVIACAGAGAAVFFVIRKKKA